MWSLVIDCSSILSIVFYSIKYTKYCIKSQYIFLFSQLIHIVKYITWEDSSGFLGFFFKYLTNYINTESFPIPVISSKEYKKNAVLLKHRNGTKNPKRSPICTPPPPSTKTLQNHEYIADACLMYLKQNDLIISVHHLSELWNFADVTFTFARPESLL